MPAGGKRFVWRMSASGGEPAGGSLPPGAAQCPRRVIEDLSEHRLRRAVRLDEGGILGESDELEHDGGAEGAVEGDR